MNLAHVTGTYVRPDLIPATGTIRLQAVANLIPTQDADGQPVGVVPCVIECILDEDGSFLARVYPGTYHVTYRGAAALPRRTVELLPSHTAAAPFIL